jgi:hypothetical protein
LCRKGLRRERQGNPLVVFRGTLLIVLGGLVRGTALAGALGPRYGNLFDGLVATEGIQRG